MISLDILDNRPSIDFNIALLGLNWYREKDPRTPLGLATIATYLSLHVKFSDDPRLYFLNYDVRDNLSDALHEILEINPRILGIGVYVWNTKQTGEILQGLRKLGYAGVIVLGGPEITYGDHKLKEEYPEANYFIRGDGEKAFLNVVLYEAKLADKLDSGIFTHESETFEDFATINNTLMISPFHNPEISSTLFGREEEGFIRWQTQRGCLYRCSFCSFPNGYNRMYEMSLDRIRMDLELFSRRNVKEVAVLDPIFFVHKDRAKKILSMIREICPSTRFEIQTKLEHLDDDLIEMISDLNIMLECGIQTLDSIVQKEIKRRNNKERIAKILRRLVNMKVPFEVHLIYGLPKQTLQSLLRDFSFLQQFTDNIQLFPLIRLKGTGLDLSIRDEDDFVFSPIFPREVIKTRWMDQTIIYRIKREGISYLKELCASSINEIPLAKDGVANSEGNY